MDFVIQVPQPFNLKATIKTHGWFQLAPFYWDEEKSALLWATKINGQSPILVTISQQSAFPKTVKINSSVAANITDKEREILIKRFRHIFNLDVDLADFYLMCKNHPLLNQVEVRGMGRLMRTESVYEDVFKSICGTNIQWKQAVKTINTISQLGDAVPGTEYHLFPSAQQILAKGESYLKDVGRVGYRSSYLFDLAERFVQGEPAALAVENGEIVGKDLFKYFLDFKGIGKVTAKYLSALYGYFEEMAVDSLVISYMRSRHFNGEIPTEKQIEEFYAKFGKWRYLAYWMEFIVADGWDPNSQ